MTVDTLTLTDFLLARIVEDEKAARKARWTEVYSYLYTYDAAHVARHGPARVLAECEAKRQVVKEVQNWTADGFPDDALSRTIIGALAAAHADHPDYREEWKP